MAMAKYQKGDVLSNVKTKEKIEILDAKHIGHTTALTVREVKADGTKQEYATNTHKLTRHLAGGDWSHSRLKVEAPKPKLAEQTVS